MTSSSVPVVKVPASTLCTPTTSTAAVPSAVVRPSRRPSSDSIRLTPRRARMLCWKLFSKRCCSRSSDPKALTTRSAPSTSWITASEALSSFFTWRERRRSVPRYARDRRYRIGETVRPIRARTWSIWKLTHSTETSVQIAARNGSAPSITSERSDSASCWMR